MIREKTTYTIDDFPGKEFSSRVDAENYVEDQKAKKNERFSSFINHSYSGRDLQRRYSLGEYGIWEIKGEDSNADMGGSHHMPSLGLVEGTLEQAIRHAVSLDRFYTWGAGGSIIKQDAPKVLKLGDN